MTSTFDKLKAIWFEQMKIESSRQWMINLNTGNLNLAHYKGFLLETYHNTAYNPQLQAFASMYLKNNPRDIVAKFYSHASSEIGHDLLALEDLIALGVEEAWIRKTNALPTTRSFFAYAVYSIQFVSPLCYLGYLFHLEFSPTTNGQMIIELLKSKGVPAQALTFLDEHAKVDIGHMKLMESYVQELVRTEEDFSIVAKSLRDSVTLHTRMLEAAFENGEKLFGQGSLSNVS